MKNTAKIIKLPTAQIKTWIEGCKRKDPRSQAEVFDRYAPTLLGICRRYLRVAEDAEDNLMESFQVIFDKINSYKGNGSFEGWMKRITINQCLMFLRKRKVTFSEIEEDIVPPTAADVLDKIFKNEILELLNGLPEGYRTVFNLYVIEGYKHREIADLLGISINTSKSQLILAKKKMAQLIEKINSNERSKGQ